MTSGQVKTHYVPTIGMRVLMRERFQAAPDWDGAEIYKVSNSKDETGPGQMFTFASSGQGFHTSSPTGKEQR